MTFRHSIMHVKVKAFNYSEYNHFFGLYNRICYKIPFQAVFSILKQNTSLKYSPQHCDSYTSSLHKPSLPLTSFCQQYGLHSFNIEAALYCIPFSLLHIALMSSGSQSPDPKTTVFSHQLLLKIH